MLYVKWNIIQPWKPREVSHNLTWTDLEDIMRHRGTMLSMHLPDGPRAGQPHRRRPWWLLGLEAGMQAVAALSVGRFFGSRAEPQCYLSFGCWDKKSRFCSLCCAHRCSCDAVAEPALNSLCCTSSPWLTPFITGSLYLTSLSHPFCPPFHHSPLLAAVTVISP